MNDEQFWIGGVADERAEWAKHEACFTPSLVARQGMELVHMHLAAMHDAAPLRTLRVLDVGAGAGVLGRELRKVDETWNPKWKVRLKIDAMECREDEREHLIRNGYDHVMITDAITLLDEMTKRSQAQIYDVVIGNPPWSKYGAIVRAAMPNVRKGGAVYMHGPSIWGHSDEPSEDAPTFDAFPVNEQHRVRRRVSYDGKAGINYKVSWWKWVHRGDGTTEPGIRTTNADGETVIGWKTYTLPDLGKPAYQWSRRPGTEDAT